MDIKTFVSFDSIVKDLTDANNALAEELRKSPEQILKDAEIRAAEIVAQIKDVLTNELQLAIHNRFAERLIPYTKNAYTLQEIEAILNL